MPKWVLRISVTRPSGPSVARKAKASGTPAKFDATPEKVISGDRTPLGTPPRIIAAAIRKPTRQPSADEATEILMEIQ